MSYIPPNPYTASKLISAASTNATSFKTAPTLLGSFSGGNVGSTPAYVKIYDKTSPPTVGTDVPVLTLILPGNLNGAGSNVHFNGLKLSNGFAIAITGGMADTDTTAVAAGQVIVNFGSTPA